MKGNNMELVLLRLNICIPVILWGVTIFLIMRGRNKIKNCNECMGTIVDFHITKPLFSKPGQLLAISPIVLYVVNGQRYQFYGNYYASTMKVGQEIKVLYNKYNFSKATIKTGLYFAPLVTSVLAFVFTSISIIIEVLIYNNVINF